METKKKEIVCERCLMNEEVVGFKKLTIGCNFCDCFFIQKKLHCRSHIDLKNILSDEVLPFDGKYHAVLGISAGYDSSSVCYWAKKAGLKVLLVHVDNGFNTKIADGNIKALINWSGFDIVYPEVDVSAFSKFYLTMIRSGVINLEHLSDLAITSNVLRVLKEKNIPLLISGVNINTEALRVASWGSPNTDKKNLLGIARFFGLKSIRSFRSLFLLNVWQIRKILFNRRVIYPLNYLDYNSFDMSKKLCEEVPGYGLYGEKHEESILTDWYQWYWLPRKYGIDKRRVVYSNNVLAGQMTREEALKKLSVPMKYKLYQMEFLTDKFGFKNVSEFEHFLYKIKPMPYERYGNDKKLRFLAKYYFGLRRRLRGY